VLKNGSQFRDPFLMIFLLIYHSKNKIRIG
jgi:hypothetical protein